MSKSARDRTAARARAEKLRQEQALAERRRERFVRIGIAVAVLAVVVGIGVAVQANRTQVDTDVALPAGVSEPGAGLPVGPDEAPVTVDLWEDFQCPACQEFEAVNAPVLEEAVAAGDVRLVLHPLTFLDSNLGNSSSVPAAQALACTADAGPEAALAFHTLVFANQPAEQPGEEAWTRDDLVGWAGEAGADEDAVRACLEEETYAGWVDNVARSATDAGVRGTPSLFIAGEQVDDATLGTMFEDPQVLRDALAQAAS